MYYFISTNLNLLHLKMNCVTFGWNWPCGSGELVFKFVNVFSLFSLSTPLGKGVALLLNKLEFPSPKDAFCQVWLKLVLWFWRRWKCKKFTNGQTDVRQTIPNNAFVIGKRPHTDCQWYFSQRCKRLEIISNM